MTDPTPKTLTCPSCGAPLEVDGTSALVRCKFCKNTAFVPGIVEPRQPTAGDALDEVRRLAESGDTIGAIRRFRELYGADLSVAKMAVDALASGKVVDVHLSHVPLSAEDTSRVLEEVKELLQRGDKIAAIKRYREVYDVSLAQAKYAVEKVEAALTGGPEPTPPPVPAVAATAVKTATVASRVGCIITAASLVFVMGILAFILLLPGGPFTDRLIANGPAVLLPGASASPDIAAAFYNSNDETYLVALVQGSNGSLAWKAPAVEGDSLFDALAWDDTHIYAANEADLFAYNRSDGSLAWQASMPDRMNYSADALLAVDGRVLVNAVDQAIRAYDASTGSLAWERRLSGYDRALRMAGSSLLVMDYPPESYDYSVYLLDPLTGAEQRSYSPACTGEDISYPLTPDVDSPLVYDAESNSLLFFSDSSYGCIQRLDLSSGQPLWQYLPDSGFSLSPYGARLLRAGEVIFFTDGANLYRLNWSNGQVWPLLSEADYEFVPLALSGETLLVRARRSRGSERFELWAVEAGTGSALWKMDMQNGAPIDPPNEMAGLVDSDSPAFTWKMLDDRLLLLTFQGEPHQLLLQSITPSDGTVTSELTVELKGILGDFYSIPEVIGWNGNTLYISLDAMLYAVDVSTGEIVFRTK